eukprot:gnl/TRDRNA2_/TRDRNA2_195911_c0_seq1.p1 gnl/TRDRNA2_/TRDRNA2_195911_c0~~gnl/TRDRNA2_/TRDRNA2_195911_c0_seq1.p1  ORF type:complete len:356 (+),score=15.14 gnl/TRDRNA2_/TRDRNA2_195911_c0_seq1:65-1132(+)
MFLGFVFRFCSVCLICSSHALRLDEPRSRANSPFTTKRCPNNLAVCIVGQLSRLESTSKMANLFRSKVMRKAYSGVHAFVVMAVNSSAYINGQFNASESIGCRENLNTHNTSFANDSSRTVKKLFRPFYKRGLYLSSPLHNITPNATNWPYNKPFLDKEKRLRDHLDQWFHLSQCAALIKQEEQVSGCQYRAIVKIRDNGIVTKPMRITVRNEVVVKQCGSWGGVNDKVLIAPRKYLDQAFEGPLKFAAKLNSGTIKVDWKCPKGNPVCFNPERFIQEVYAYYDVKVARVAHNDIPVVDGRCERVSEVGAHEWCLVPSWKDCYPNGRLSYTTCKHMPQTDIEAWADGLKTLLGKF